MFFFLSLLVCQSLKVCDSWRAYTRERTRVEAHGFLDGDLLEQVLEFPRPVVEEVATACNTTADALLRKLEELSHLH